MRFGVYWALFVASFKMFVRNRGALFFSLVVPLVIMLIFGVLSVQIAFAAIELGPVTSTELKVVGTLEYDARADTWSGPFKIQMFDADGHEIFVDHGTFTGTRIPIETLD